MLQMKIGLTMHSFSALIPCIIACNVRIVTVFNNGLLVLVLVL